MTYLITGKCIECGACEMFCENGAVSETDTTYVIDETKCQSCETCTTYCPIDGAIIKKERSGVMPAYLIREPTGACRVSLSLAVTIVPADGSYPAPA